jgi:hypothetical protein
VVLDTALPGQWGGFSAKKISPSKSKQPWQRSTQFCLTSGAGLTPFHTLGSPSGVGHSPAWPMGGIFREKNFPLKKQATLAAFYTALPNEWGGFYPFPHIR